MKSFRSASFCIMSCPIHILRASYLSPLIIKREKGGRERRGGGKGMGRGKEIQLLLFEQINVHKIHCINVHANV